MTSGNSYRGLLSYDKSGPKIESDDSHHLESSTDTTFGIIDSDEGSNSILPLDLQDRVALNPIAIYKIGYSVNPLIHDSMYPPSTDGWITHVQTQGNDALYSFHKIHTRNRLLLIISSLDTNQFIKAHVVYPYEIAILMMNQDWTLHNKLFFEGTKESDILKILEAPPPSWSHLTVLVDGVTIPNLKMGLTMGETLSQLVPHSFPENVRVQIMAFLAWLESAEIPDEDPADFITRNLKFDVFISLVTGHLRCMIDGVKPPSYVRILMLADSGHLKLTDRSRPVEMDTNPWNVAWWKLCEIFPDWMGRVVNVAKELTKRMEVITELPVSEMDALQSREAWNNRLAMIRQGLVLRGHVNLEPLGLKSAIYIGAAHQWPHKHLELSIRLGFKEVKQPHLQVMILPPTSLERVMRVLPNIRQIDLDLNFVNLSLYDDNQRIWKLNTNLISKSLGRNRSIKQLKKEFGGSKRQNPVRISDNESKLLDMVSWGIYLRPLETDKYSNHYAIPKGEIKDGLTRLSEQGIVSMRYLLSMQKLTSLCIIANGPSMNVCSLTRALLKHTPSAHARVSDNGNSSVIISRVPSEKAHSLMSSLPEAGAANGVKLRILPISAYMVYRHNLFQRLLKEDGSWDDDISGLLGQARLHSEEK